MVLLNGQYFGGIQEIKVLFLREYDYFCEEDDYGYDAFFIEKTKN